MQPQPTNESPKFDDELDAALRTAALAAEVGVDALIDPKHPDAKTLSYYAYDQQKLEYLLDHPKVIRTPIVRNGKQATVGYKPEVWKTWE